jgi:hypothetical protein
MRFDRQVYPATQPASHNKIFKQIWTFGQKKGRGKRINRKKAPNKQLRLASVHFLSLLYFISSVFYQAVVCRYIDSGIFLNVEHHCNQNKIKNGIREREA